MANIQHWLDQIRRAVYGREVRSSIADAIEAINKEQSHLDGAFNQLIINAGNSNAEIVDARVKADGTQFNTLGQRLNKNDEDLLNLSNNFDDISKEVIEARTDRNGTDHGRLKIRLDDIDEQLDTKLGKKETEYVNVKLYGAKGDGVTDDTQAIKDALAEQNNIYFPSGTYIISDSITLSKSTNIKGVGNTHNWGVGDGAILKATHNDYIFKCSWGNQNNFYKINFDGKGIHTPCSSFIVECGFTGDIGIYHARVTTIDRCIFRNCTTSGIEKMVDSKILNSFFYSNEIGIYMNDSNDNIISGNKIEWNNIGIKLDTNVFNLIQNNIFDRNTTYGIHSLNGSQLSIRNNQFERSLVSHLRLNGSIITVTGNSFLNKNSEDNGTGVIVPNNSIHLQSVNKILISDNLVESTKMFNSTYDHVSNLTVYNNLINGESDNHRWIKIGSITLAGGKEGDYRFQWSSLDFLNANGYDVNIITMKTVNGINEHYNNVTYYLHKNNGLYVHVKNTDNINEVTYDIHAKFEHIQWSKR